MAISIKKRLENAFNDLEDIFLFSDLTSLHKVVQLVSHIVISFLPDYIICVFKKDKFILSNATKEVYEKYDKHCKGVRGYPPIDVRSITDQLLEQRKNILHSGVKDLGILTWVKFIKGSVIELILPEKYRSYIEDIEHGIERLAKLPWGENFKFPEEFKPEYVSLEKYGGKLALQDGFKQFYYTYALYRERELLEIEKAIEEVTGTRLVYTTLCFLNPCRDNTRCMFKGDCEEILCQHFSEQDMFFIYFVPDEKEKKLRGILNIDIKEEDWRFFKEKFIQGNKEGACPVTSETFVPEFVCMEDPRIKEYRKGGKEQNDFLRKRAEVESIFLAEKPYLSAFPLVLGNTYYGMILVPLDMMGNEQYYSINRNLFRMISGRVISVFKPLQLEEEAKRGRAYDRALSINVKSGAHIDGSGILPIIGRKIRNGEYSNETICEYVFYFQNLLEYYGAIAAQLGPIFGKCSVKELLDNFNKEVGRILTEGRFNEDIEVEYRNCNETTRIKIPWGLHVGGQAFYAVLKNYIRNIVRHGEIEDFLQLRFTIEDFDEKYLKLTVSSNGNFLPEQEKEKARKYAMEVYKSLLPGTLHDPSVHTGIKEMQIAACLLRGGNIIDVDREIKDSEPPFLEFDVNEAIERNKASYYLYLLKEVPYKVALEEDDLEALRQKRISNLPDFLITNASNVKYIIEHMNEFPQRMVLIDDGIDNEVLKYEWVKKRMLILKNEELGDIDDQNYNYELYYKLQKMWFEKIMEKEALHEEIRITDGEATELNNKLTEVLKEFKNSNKLRFKESKESSVLKLEHVEEEYPQHDLIPYTKSGPLKFIFMDGISEESDEIKKKIMALELLIILYLKVAIIDDRIYTAYGNRFEPVGIKIFPEDEDTMEKLSSEANEYTFLVVHYSFKHIDKFLNAVGKRFPYIFIETTRRMGELTEREKDKIKIWVNDGLFYIPKIFPYSNLRGCFQGEERVFGKKYSLVNTLLSL